MKGAIGNALILNIVITFIFIFLSLLIGSMAYSKAYKTKNYLINLIDKYEREGKSNFNSISATTDKIEWDKDVNEYLGKIGYMINSKSINTCPDESTKYNNGYEKWVTNENGRYDYCVYRRYSINAGSDDPKIMRKYNYRVLVYMKFDLPVIGDFIKIPITGETKSYTVFR